MSERRKFNVMIRGGRVYMAGEIFRGTLDDCLELVKRKYADCWSGDKPIHEIQILCEDL